MLQIMNASLSTIPLTRYEINQAKIIDAQRGEEEIITRYILNYSLNFDQWHIIFFLAMAVFQS